MMLSESDIDETLIKDSKMFHFGSLSMTDKKCVGRQREKQLRLQKSLVAEPSRAIAIV